VWKQSIAFCDFVWCFSATNKIAMNDGEYIPSEDENLGGLHVGSIDNICDVMDAEEVTNYSVQFGAADLILFMLSDDIFE
jgi:hypothetical protein